jgi:predicted transcriptional regulator
MYTYKLYFVSVDKHFFYLLEVAPIRRRDSTRLIYDVLGVVRGEPVSKYQIMCRAKLSFWQAEGIISFFLHNGHAKRNLDGNGTTKYKATSKGEQFWSALGNILEELDSFFIGDSASRRLNHIQSPIGRDRHELQPASQNLLIK